ADGVHRFEGTVNQYTGDGIMALFGAPIAHEDHAQRACYAALQLREELRRYSEELRIAKGLDFSVRMGLNSGDVVIGKIGDDLRMDYTAQGHTVGLAARMEQIAAPDQTYLTEETARLVSGFFELRDLGPTPVKGRKEPIGVHVLEGVGAHRTRFDVSRARGLSRFVGRADEMATLEAALARSKEGNGQVLGVVAEAGTGKSRLCFEFVEGCRASGLQVLEGRGVAHGRNIPLLPVLQVFRAYFGIEEQDSDRTAREKIAGRLLLIDEKLRGALAIVFELLAVADPERRAPGGDPEGRQRQLFSVLRQIIRRDDGEPIVTLIEDLHWIDDASEAWLEQLVDSVSGTRTLLLVNFRPEYGADWMRKSYYQQLALAPLGPPAVRDLLADLLGDDASISGLADTIHARTAGNPFFTEEVVQALIESGSLEGTHGHYRLVTPIDELEVPATVHAVLAARIDRLAEREKQVLQTASVIGKEFTEPILSEVAELPARELSDALAILKDSEFILEKALYPVAEYTFKHPLTQEVALHSQLRERRSRVHAAVARAIEEASPQKLDERAAELAHHWEEAEEKLPAARWHRRAAEWVGASNLSQAIAHWRKVRELGASLPDDREALEHNLVACQRWLAFVFRVGAPKEEIDEIFSEGRSVGEKLGDPRALFYLTHGMNPVLVTKGLMTDALRNAEQAYRLADDLGDPETRVLACDLMADTTYWLGDHGAAVRWGDETLSLVGDDTEIGIATSGTPVRTWALVRRGVAKAQMGRLEEGRREVEEAVRLGRDRGHGEVSAWALTLLCLIDEVEGRLEEPLRRAQQALEYAERVQSPFTQNVAHQTMGLAYLLRGDPHEAVDLLERSHRFRRERRTGLYSGPSEMADLAAANLAVGNIERARALVEEALEFGERGGAWMRGARVFLVRAQILRESRGKAARDEIEATLDRADSLIREKAARAWVPFVLEERARFAELLNDSATAERHRREAHRLYTEMGATGHAERLA
ncbi:MAG: AAA family ATPase, partial [Myxococcota bacterium]